MIDYIVSTNSLEDLLSPKVGAGITIASLASIRSRSMERECTVYRGRVFSPWCMGVVGGEKVQQVIVLPW